MSEEIIVTAIKNYIFIWCFCSPPLADKAGGGFFRCRQTAIYLLCWGIFTFVCKVLRYCYVENGTIQSEKYKVNSRNKIREVIEILSIDVQTNKNNYQKRPELPVWFQESGARILEPGRRRRKGRKEK